MSAHAGEVIESTTRTYVALSPYVGQSPSFGTFVKTDTQPVVYGVVCEIITESREPGRRASALGMPLEELRREQPQIFEILQTEFHVLTVAHSQNGKMRFSLSPVPPSIHSFVYECTDEEVSGLCSEDFYLHTIASAPNVPVDELLVASLGFAQEARSEDTDYIVRMGKSLVRIFKDDYERLSAVMRRLVG